MKVAEVRRALKDLGWKRERWARGSHERWRGSDGRLTTVSRDSENRNVHAFLRQLRREAAATTAQPAIVPPQKETAMRFFVGHNKTKGSDFAEIYFSDTELEQLGGDRQLTVKDLGDGRFALEPSKDGEVRPRPDGNRWRLRTTRLTGVPLTGVTTLPHSPNGKGFILRPFEADFREVGRPPRQKRVDQSARGHVIVRHDKDVSETVEPPKAKQDPVPPAPRAATLDDLKASLEFTREYARELGATLYIDESGELRAKLEIVL